MILREKRKLVYGWGINDVDYSVTKSYKINGKSKQVWICPYYEDWRGILERCFCPNYKLKQPTYINVTVCEEWKHLSNFIKWVDSQPNRDWVNCVPDKDILIDGNKHYSPDTVVYVSQAMNNFFNESGSSKNGLLRGVSKDKRFNCYVATCVNPLTEGKNNGRYIGRFKTELEAHLAWKAKKNEYAHELAKSETNDKIKNSLLTRFAP